MTVAAGMFVPRLRRRRRIGTIVATTCAVLSLIGVMFLSVLLVRIGKEGWDWLTMAFLTNFPSVLSPELAGIKSALWGTIWLTLITVSVSVPIGVAAAVYLEEFARPGRVRWFIHINISNLAGVPSIVYGILGLAVFVRWMHLGRSVLSGGLTLALLVLPVVIIASREALSAVPKSIRLASYALGATRWQTVRSHVLPAALPGIMTGVILALSRAIGEASPLLILGALTYVAFVPQSPWDPFTAIPLQVYDWIDRPQPEFHHLAAAGIIVLLGILLPMNALAIGVRAWHQRKKAW
ncbi:MAG: phosphate ABC transporter permease PstA [Phycisphaerales bacterium]|nr:phosphate ABC transporter permease PstA [Phycisphaerales bacterium]